MTRTGRRLAIPDIHGCRRTLQEMLRGVLKLQPGDTLYLLGDYIDRGPDSRGVLDTLLSLREEGRDIRMLRGNHEEMLLQAATGDILWHATWIANGGEATLRSFGVQNPREIPPRYLSLLDSLPWYLETPDYLLVHAGMNFDGDPYADREAMIWTRNDEVRREKIGGRRLVCGHTPRSRPAILRSLSSDRLAIDNGCVYRGIPGLGALAALDLDTLEIFFQENIDIRESTE